MSKHTPGQWSVNPDQIGTIETADGMHIANVSQVLPLRMDLKQAQRRANARLIAAAPELLEALKAIVKGLADADEEGLIEHVEQMENARAAIAKATGEGA